MFSLLLISVWFEHKPTHSPGGSGEGDKQSYAIAPRRTSQKRCPHTNAGGSAVSVQLGFTRPLQSRRVRRRYATRTRMRMLGAVSDGAEPY